MQCSLGSSQHLGATTCKKRSSESRCGDYQRTSIPEYTFLLALDCIFRQELQCTFRRESSCTGPQEPEGGRCHEIRSKNPRNQIKESAESDLRWYKSPWEWSYNAPWALVGNSREALDGTLYQSPGRQTLMKNEEKRFLLSLKFCKILARLPWCKRSDNPRCTWSLVPACKVRNVEDIYSTQLYQGSSIFCTCTSPLGSSGISSWRRRCKFLGGFWYTQSPSPVQEKY